MGLLAWAYWPNLQHLYTIWDGEPNYSHGKLVIPIALYIFWRRIVDSKGRWATGRGTWWTWIALIAVLAGRDILYENNSLWSEDALLIPTVACLMLTLGGWPLLREAWPAVLFLVFMLPLPESIKNILSLPLQTLATLGSVYVMQLTGLRAIPDGHVINLPDGLPGAKTLEVALACNGLSMLMTLAATVTATVILFPLSPLKRVVVLASAIPIALLSNIARIVATGWCYHLIEGEAKKLAHDYSGLLMMPLAVVLVYLEVRLVSWLTGETGSETDEPDRPILAIIPRAKSDKLEPSHARRADKGRLTSTVSDPDADPSPSKVSASTSHRRRDRRPIRASQTRAPDHCSMGNDHAPNSDPASAKDREAAKEQAPGSHPNVGRSLSAGGEEIGSCPSVCTAPSVSAVSSETNRHVGDKGFITAMANASSSDVASSTPDGQLTSSVHAATTDSTIPNGPQVPKEQIISCTPTPDRANSIPTHDA
jgi:exosortase